MRENFKIGISMLLAISLLFTSFAILASDDDNFFEGFENGSIPSDWVIVNNGDNKYGATWEITHGYEYAHSGYYAVACSPGDQYEYQDEWLIFNASSLNISKYEKPFLMFWHKAGFAFKDNKPNQLLISNTIKNLNDFKVVNKSIFYYPDGTLKFDWTRVKVDLQDYKNDSSLYIAWRYRSTNGEVWRLDDIYIGEYFDDTPPTISDVKVEPNVQTIGRYVNISCNVTDDTLNGLDKVVINITYPNGSYHEEDMLLFGLSTYHYNYTYNLDGTYSFYIKATDRYNNSEETSTLEFTILRSFDVYILPSTIINENSNFTVQVKDAITGDPVENATILFDDNQNTTDISGNASFTAPDVTNDTTYTILVSKQGYLNCSINITVKNIDSLAPQIKNIVAHPTTQLINKSVNISCIVVDDIAVDLVKVRVYGPTGFTPVNMTMSETGDGKYYYNTNYSMVGRYNYSVWASDTSGNVNVSENKSFYIVDHFDVTPPNISNVSIKPKEQVVDGYVNISCVVTDDIAVANVSLNLTLPTGSNLVVFMSNSGDKYYLNSTYSIVGLYNFTIIADDVSGNRNESSVYNFTIFSNAPPEITNVTINPSFRINPGYVNISCDVYDDFGIKSVKINITLPDGNYSVGEMYNLVNTTTYYHNSTYSKGVYVFYIESKDVYDVTSQSNIYTFQIGDSQPPNSSVDKLPLYWYKSDHMNIWATATDDLSGVKNVTLYYRYSPDNKTWSEWKKYQTLSSPPWKWSFNTTEGAGYYQLYCIAADVSGNVENKSKKEIEFGFDNIPPTATVNTIIPYLHIKPFVISAMVDKNEKYDLSPISEVDLFYRWSDDNSSWGDWDWYGRDSNDDDGWSWYFDVNKMNGRYYQFYAKARDAADNNETNATLRIPEAFCEIKPNTIPSVEIIRPKIGYLYINDEEKRHLPFEKTVIIGKITIEAIASDPDNISKVEFWVNNKLKSTDTEAPYTYTFDERILGKCKIKVIAYDTYGNQNNATVNVFMIKLRGGSNSYSSGELLRLIENMGDKNSGQVGTTQITSSSSAHVVSSCLKINKLSVKTIKGD